MAWAPDWVIHACTVLAVEVQLQTHCFYPLWPQAMSFPKLFSVIDLYIGLDALASCTWLLDTSGCTPLKMSWR